MPGKCYYETDELPTTQGQPNPRKNRLKVAFGPLLLTKDFFFLSVGIAFI